MSTPFKLDVRHNLDVPLKWRGGWIASANAFLSELA